MSDRLWKITATYGPDDAPMMWEEATVDEVLSWVRRGVESGTIKGEEVMWCELHELPIWGTSPDSLRTVCQFDGEFGDPAEPCYFVSKLLIPGSDERNMKECPECAGTGVCCAHDPCHRCKGAGVVPVGEA